MENQVEDQPVLNHIQHLVAEEHRLHEQRAHHIADRKRLEEVQIELDQCRDLLRQRRALRDVGLDPDDAEVRPPQVFENYEQWGFVVSERTIAGACRSSRAIGSPEWQAQIASAGLPRYHPMAFSMAASIFTHAALSFHATNSVIETFNAVRHTKSITASCLAMSDVDGE